MKRRTFLGTVAAGAGVLAAPASGAGCRGNDAEIRSAQDLASVDPIQSPAR